MLADLHQGNADRAPEVMRSAGFDVSTTTVDVSSRDSVLALVQTATLHGAVTGLNQPVQATFPNARAGDRPPVRRARRVARA